MHDSLRELDPWTLCALLGGGIAGTGAGALLLGLRELALFLRPGLRAAFLDRKRPSLAAARHEYEAGEIERAFLVLRLVRRQDPEDEASALLMWDVARDAGFPEDAEQALLHVIRRELERGDEALAVQHWTWLRKAADVITAEPSLLLRMAPLLERAGQIALCLDALRGGLPAAAASGSGELAARVARAARFVDPGLAEEATWAALADEHLPAALRAELEASLAGLYAAEVGPGAEPAALDLAPGESIPAGGRRPGDAAAVACPTPPLNAELLGLFTQADERAPRREESLSGLRLARVLDVEPVALRGDAVVVKIGSEQRRVRFERIEAVTAAAVEGLASEPILVVDLLMACARPAEPLRVVRFRSDRFSAAAALQPGRTPTRALQWLAETLLARSNARPLPDRDALRGRPYRHWSSLEGYCREVLGAEPSAPLASPS